MYVYVSCLHFILQWNHLLINRDNKETFCLFKSFLFYSLPPLCLYLPAQKLTSPTCLSSEGPYAHSAPKPYKET